MNSRTPAWRHIELPTLSRRGGRSTSLRAAGYLPGSDVLLIVAAVFLALSVFELAAWLATAPLTTLIYSVTLVPVALFFTSVASARQR